LTQMAGQTHEVKEMAIKSFDELNEFERRGLIAFLVSDGWHVGTISNSEWKSGETRASWSKGKIIVEQQAIHVEVE